MKRFRMQPMDGGFLYTAVALAVLGVLIVYDASYARACHSKLTGFDGGYYVKKQLLYVAMGMLAMWGVSRVNLGFLRRITPYLFVASICILPLVFVPGLGVKANGAWRWVKIGPIRFQPSEVTKICLVLYLASVFAKQQFETRNFKSGLALHLVILGLICAIVVKQRDLGTTVIIAGSAMTMIFLAGGLMRHLGYLAVSGAATVGYLVVTEPYRMKRLLVFLNPMSDYHGSGYQIVHSLIAFGSGGPLGAGFGEGREKYYLPAAHTDFIFASIGEEIGLWGTLAILALFAGFVYMGLCIARRCRSPYCGLLAGGLTATIGLQAVINVAVATSSMPATGVPLPFISFGGTSIVLTLIAVGIVLNVSRHEKAEFAEPVSHENSANWWGNGRAHLSRPERRGGNSRSASRRGTALRGQQARSGIVARRR